MLPVHWILVATMVTAGGPALPPGVGPADADRLRAAVADVLALDEAALRALVPTQSGFLFVGCPNCRGGRQETQLQWSLTSPDEVFCGHCRHRYPSPQYPMNQVAEHTAPDGSPVRYPYWADAKGYRYYFAARADELKKTFLERRCLGLARLAFAANEPRAARLAVVLLDRFAEVFGRWCWHYDYPFRQKEIHDGVIPPERWQGFGAGAQGAAASSFALARPWLLCYNGKRGVARRCSSVAEQLFRKQQVVGSIPTTGSSIRKP